MDQENAEGMNHAKTKEENRLALNIAIGVGLWKMGGSDLRL